MQMAGHMIGIDHGEPGGKQGATDAALGVGVDAEGL
jgi:hypothetical protein